MADTTELLKAHHAAKNKAEGVRYALDHLYAYTKVNEIEAEHAKLTAEAERLWKEWAAAIPIPFGYTMQSQYGTWWYTKSDGGGISEKFYTFEDCKVAVIKHWQAAGSPLDYQLCNTSSTKITLFATITPLYAISLRI